MKESINFEINSNNNDNSSINNLINIEKSEKCKTDINVIFPNKDDESYLSISGKNESINLNLFLDVKEMLNHKHGHGRSYNFNPASIIIVNIIAYYLKYYKQPYEFVNEAIIYYGCKKVPQLLNDIRYRKIYQKFFGDTIEDENNSNTNNNISKDDEIEYLDNIFKKITIDLFIKTITQIKTIKLYNEIKKLDIFNVDETPEHEQLKKLTMSEKIKYIKEQFSPEDHDIVEKLAYKTCI